MYTRGAEGQPSSGAAGKPWKRFGEGAGKMLGTRTGGGWGDGGRAHEAGPRGLAESASGIIL